MRENPYPGLRPFRRDEAHLFFGRDEQIDHLLDKLAQTRFISVTGLSGSGKSSLVQAGLLPNLEFGYLTDAGADWGILSMCPGITPIQNLAQAMFDAKLTSGLSSSGTLPENTRHCEESATKQSPDTGEIASQSLAMTSRPFGEERKRVQALTERLSSGGHLEFARILNESLKEGQRRSFLLVVDQFEELFRYENLSRLAERKFFVEMLLISAKQQDVPIYMVITIRSDWLGQCALFQGLPEVMNAGQFLVPRLTQEQMRLAITAPARVVGGAIDDRLARRLLEDSELNSDQLPVVQHCLMRMWTLKTTAVDENTPVTLTLADYENPRINGLTQALSQHADEAYAELPDEYHQKIAERLFRCLTEDDLRRPAMIVDIAAVADVPVTDVVTVVNVFRQTDRCFLNPSGDTLLTPETVVDISHESLIRQWNLLKKWVGQENRSAEMYRHLEVDAILWKNDKHGLWRNPELEIILNWWEKERPSLEWASRYGEAFKLAENFLEKSRHAQEEEDLRKEEQRQKELQRTRGRLAWALIGLIIVMGFAMWAGWERSKAQVARNEAELRSNSFREMVDAMFGFLSESGQNKEFLTWTEETSKIENLTPALHLMIDLSESIDKEEKKYWHSGLSDMSGEYKAQLLDILGSEFAEKPKNKKP